MKTRKKGNRTRRACIERLEAKGWLVDVVEKTGRFVKVKDLYALFDLICIKAPGRVLLVQVTCNTPHTHRRLAEFKMRYSGLELRQYVWINRKGWVIYFYEADGTWTTQGIKRKRCPSCIKLIARADDHVAGYSWQTKKKYYVCKKVE